MVEGIRSKACTGAVEEVGPHAQPARRLVYKALSGAKVGVARLQVASRIHFHFDEKPAQFSLDAGSKKEGMPL